jgi:hypothetical protein
MQRSLVTHELKVDPDLLSQDTDDDAGDHIGMDEDIVIHDVPISEEEPDVPASEASGPYHIDPAKLRALSEPLFDKCDMTMLGLIEELLRLQSDTKAKQVTIDRAMKLVVEITTPDHPATYRQAKQMVIDSCMPGMRRIDACPEDCIVYYNSPHSTTYQYAKRETCPTCGADRYKAGPEGSSVPAKVFFYIPIRDHVDAIFCQPEIVRHFMRDGDGLPHGGDMNKKWADVADSPEFERVVHEDDPTFGQEVITLHRATLACSVLPILNHSLISCLVHVL